MAEDTGYDLEELFLMFVEKEPSVCSSAGGKCFEAAADRTVLKDAEKQHDFII